MKKLALVVAFISIGYLGVKAQNAPKKEIKQTATLSTTPSETKITNVVATEVTVAKTATEKKTNCTAEEKKSCSSASGKKSCCSSKKAEAKVAPVVNQ